MFLKTVGRWPNQRSIALPMPRYLLHELLLVGQRGQAVEMGLAQQLDAAGRDQLLKALQHVGRPFGTLVEQRAAQAERHLEPAIRPPNEIRQQTVGRQVALVRNPTENAPVGLGIEVLGVSPDVEDPVLTEPEGLVDLGVDADVGHRALHAGDCLARS